MLTTHTAPYPFAMFKFLCIISPFDNSIRVEHEKFCVPVSIVKEQNGACNLLGILYYLCIHQTLQHNKSAILYCLHAFSINGTQSFEKRKYLLFPPFLNFVKAPAQGARESTDVETDTLELTCLCAGAPESLSESDWSPSTTMSAAAAALSSFSMHVTQSSYTVWFKAM